MKMKEQYSSSDDQIDGKVDSKRRKFLKKAAYTAPKLITLGLLVHSGNTLADGSSSGFSSPAGPPQPPDGWNP